MGVEGVELVSRLSKPSSAWTMHVEVAWPRRIWIFIFRYPSLISMILLFYSYLIFVFHSDNVLCEQRDGIATSIPLGPTLADVALSRLEKRVRNNIFQTLPYRRYIDDVLFFTGPNHVFIILNHFRSFLLLSRMS